MPPKIEIVSDDYRLEDDFVPSGRISLRPWILLGLVILGLCGGCGGGAYYFLGQAASAQAAAKASKQAPILTAEFTQEPTALPSATPIPATPTVTLPPSSTPTASDTPSARDLLATLSVLTTATSTPTASPSPDFCWWLTPSATPSATAIPVTPDRWQIQATTVLLETGTPTATATATVPPPRAWCDQVTFTPVPPTVNAEATGPELMTATFNALPTGASFPTLAVPATSTQPPPPERQERSGQSQPQVIIQTSEPKIIYLTAPPQNNPPQVIVIPAITQVVITATLAPTEPPTNAPTVFVSETSTDFPPTAVATDTAIPTTAPTNTDIATAIPSPTATATDTATEVLGTQEPTA